ncbi:hypothetical protein DACRYDRAFT_81791 [Dacryopinax primogenitus]|uniref:RNA polymerase II subunit A C-terminal domain phosphatase n=1 Tax=Dacryopinax primogenitus (strain DJM 731) TaxID=1858805 RepID=M5FV37_DACPD|nr:uncharacterized protein DACRYDRAFT_81791 [Dacryopinax primogenitus]EJU00119.1 hypothetical protein DACRYDRAFT_81791 [Dacryopinax primogenitus]
MAAPRTPTLVHPTPSLPFPIRITLILTPSGSHIPRGTNILYYEYASHGVEVGEGNKKGETRTGAWECPVEGEVVKWRVGKGQVIKDASKPIVEILEPCRHEEQVNGLCLICLKDVSGIDYTGFSDTSRATVAMVHDAASITVSPEVAARLEHESQIRLLGSRKLSLVVDLDQTIIQATVDPTVGEWIDQGRAWEEGREGARKNPNWEALRDVGRFRLSEERKVVNGRGGKVIRSKREDTAYYIKPRPGLHAFLSRLSELYEMHVYTMGTRSYASQVVRLIDPLGNLFGSRVLSRDESGSLTFKNLTRLFPCNTSSAVIIDDRADVWDLSRANLVKVVPYDFFSVGDINATFLPALAQNGTPSSSPSPGPTNTTVPPSPTLADEEQPADLIPTVALALEEAEESEKEEKQKAAMELLQEEKLAKDRESRPLQKLMEELEKREARERSERARSREGSSRGSSRERQAEGEKEPQEEQAVNGHVSSGGESPTSTAVPGETEEEPVTERALLTNDDHELSRVLRILEEIHRRYFQQYDLYVADKNTRKEPSVMEIIPEMKAEVLSGVHLVFSSLIPIDMPHQNTDLWRQALQFGAACYTRVAREVTHVVAAKRGTEKVRQGVARGCKIVNPYWFMDSVAAWERKKEEEYPLEGMEGASPAKEGLPEEAAGTRSPSPPTINGNHENAPSENGDVGVRDGEDGMGAGDEPGEGEEDLGEDVDLGELDWNEMDAELEDLMEEEDGDDDDQPEDGDYPDEPEEESEAAARARGRKRRRAEDIETPAESDDEHSAKRRKRRDEGSLVGKADEGILQASQMVDDDPNNGHDLADDENDEDLDDFLARDLEGMEDEEDDGGGDEGE